MELILWNRENVFKSFNMDQPVNLIGPCFQYRLEFPMEWSMSLMDMGR